MRYLDLNFDPQRQLDIQALLEQGIFTPQMPVVPGAAPRAQDLFGSDSYQQGMDNEAVAQFHAAVQQHVAANPELLQQLNQIREDLGLQPFNPSAEVGSQDPAALMGEDLMALLVMWALQQGNRQQGGQQHAGMPQQSFSNQRPASWNGGGGGGGSSGGGGGGTASAGHSHGGGAPASGGGGAAPATIPSGPVPGLPDDLGPVTAGQNGVPGGLKPNAARGAAVVREVFGFDGTIGGLGERSNKSDHPYGNAIDVMTNSNMQQGQEIGDYFREHNEALGVKYVIFNQRIASPRTGWQWEPMEDRGSPTANHKDHPHISFNGPE